MPDLVTDSGSKEANEKHPKKGKLGKYKWYIVGALAVIAVLVFYFTRSSAANSSSANTADDSAAQTAAAGIDPSTGIPYASEYGSGGSDGSIGPAGPAGPTGATGAKGAKGAKGATGKTGKTGKTGTIKKIIKKKKTPVKTKTTGPAKKTINVGTSVHPAIRLAAAHHANQHRAA
jgi:Collagen triple helix repeat (20 copies)